jgi:Predicted periplasmic protein (DUF2092)
MDAHQIRTSAIEPSGQASLHPDWGLPRLRNSGRRQILTVNNKDGKDYAQIEATGTAEELIELLRKKHGIVVAPGADLLLSNVFNVLMTDVVRPLSSAKVSLTALSATTSHSATWKLTGNLD